MCKHARRGDPHDPGQVVRVTLHRRHHGSATPEVPDPQGLRSGAAARKDAELVPLWVGKTDPALIAGLADVGMSST
ncbi:hypothetical protein GCM10009780_77570 [Actinomadura alba]